LARRARFVLTFRPLPLLHPHVSSGSRQLKLLKESLEMKKFVVALLAGLCLTPAIGWSAGSVKAGEAKSAPCAACHGPRGNSVNPMWPKLAGQHFKYIFAQLRAFKQKQRVNAIMNAQAADLTAQDMRDLAAYYAEQVTSPGSAGKDVPQLGQQIYLGGVAARSIPACAACHGPAGLGNAAAVYPRLSYQHAEYTANQLRAYRAGERAGASAEIMRDVAARMTDEEIEAVSQYVSGLHRAGQ
jgi:cytochrome c553